MLILEVDIEAQGVDLEVEETHNTFVGRCYHCQEYGHPTWKFPKKDSSSTSGGERKLDRRAQIVQKDEVESSSSSKKLIARVEVGEIIMMKRQILKTTK